MPTTDPVATVVRKLDGWHVDTDGSSVVFGTEADAVDYALTLTTTTDPVATDRAEHEPCQRGTVGCAIDHQHDTPCETW